MARPKQCRRVGSTPESDYFKPRGIPLSMLEEVVLTVDEFEAIRLADLDGLYQEQAAEKMNISRQTFGRIIARRFPCPCPSSPRDATGTGCVFNRSVVPASQRPSGAERPGRTPSALHPAVPAPGFRSPRHESEFGEISDVQFETH